MADVRRVAVERRNYSRLPWRLIDSTNDTELRFEHEPFTHPDCGDMIVPVVGYQTKTAAVEALGRLAGILLDRQGGDDDG